MLTPRQREVLALRAAGHTHKEIAERLGIKPGTLKAHVLDIHSRLGCVGANAIRMVEVARRAGVI